MSDDELEVNDDVSESEAEDDVIESQQLDSSISAKEAERRRIQAEIDAFLQKGGEITKVDSSITTDPPKKPESSYGGQPI